MEDQIPCGEDPYTLNEELFKTKTTCELVWVIISMILYIVFVCVMLFGIAALGLWYAETASLVYILLFALIIVIIVIVMISGIIAMIRIRREDQEAREQDRDFWNR